MPAVNRMSSLAAREAVVLHATKNRGVFPGDSALDDDMRRFWIKFQMAAADQSVPLRVHTGWRSPEDQERLREAGFSKAKAWSSAHNYGYAIDVIHTEKAWSGMTRAGWHLLGTLGKEVARRMNLPIVWGGDWSFYDPAHWELEGWRHKALLEWRSSPPWVQALVPDPVIAGMAKVDYPPATKTLPDSVAGLFPAGSARS